jgi:hypothetical protein
MLAALDVLDALVDSTPPSDAQGRFGNPAYRTWFDQMVEVCWQLPLNSYEISSYSRH